MIAIDCGYLDEIDCVTDFGVFSYQPTFILSLSLHKM